MIQDDVHFRPDRRSTSPTSETMIPFPRPLKITRTGGGLNYEIN
jgi:hypothetical protein